MQAEAINEQVGKYRLIKKLATGGMAQIYLAEQSGPGGFKKRLVIKRILPHLVDDEKFLQMFQDEARVAAMMNHPNIVQIFELGEAEKSYYIAMEFVDGFNLRSVIQLSNENGIWLAPEYIAKLGSQICDGLEYAHNFCDAEGNHLNIIHRDISPQNIILSTQGIIRIVDFGIAKAKSNAQETQAGIIKGKLAYMSPEQVKGQSLDRRSDLFSLGIVLYELATHQRPFQGKSDIDMLRAILDSKPTPVEQYRPDFPPELSKIIYRALAKERDERYASAREFHMDLETFIQSSRKTVTPFQLQELVRKLKQLDTSSESSGETSSPSQPRPAMVPARPAPPPAIPRATAPPPPPPIPGGGAPAIPAGSLAPASPDDFDEDGETMWATDIKIPNKPPQGNAPTASPGPSYQPSSASGPPAPAAVAPSSAQPQWGAPPGSEATSSDEWDEADATVLSPSPLAGGLKPEPPPGHPSGAAFSPTPPMGNASPPMGVNDLETLNQPVSFGASGGGTPSGHGALAADMVNNYLPQQNQTPPGGLPMDSDFPTILDQPSLQNMRPPGHQSISASKANVVASAPTHLETPAGGGRQWPPPASHDPSFQQRNAPTRPNKRPSNNKKLIILLTLGIVLLAGGLLTYLFVLP